MKRLMLLSLVVWLTGYKARSQEKVAEEDSQSSWIAWMGSPLMLQERLRKEGKRGVVYVVCQDTTAVKAYLKRHRLTSRPVKLVDGKNREAMARVRMQICM